MKNRLQPGKLQSDRHLWQLGKSNSSAQGHILFLPFPDKASLQTDSEYEDWPAVLQLPETIRGSEPGSSCLILIFYPIPTHSIHNFIALLSTVAASPRKIPTRKNTRPAASKKICIAFSDFIKIPFVTVNSNCSFRCYYSKSAY